MAEIRRPRIETPHARLPLEKLRAIEREFKVYLERPVAPARSPNQQFGVYVGDPEVHIADIVSDDRYFSEYELRRALADVLSSR